MSHPVITAEKYTAGTAKAVRAEGRVPAAVYGQSKETQNISIDKQDFRRLYRKVGKAMLAEIEFGGKNIPVLVHIVDLHPISGDPVHVDFHAVDMNKEVHATVPVHLNGTAPAVKLLGGTLTTMTDQVEIKCLPKNLIASVEASLEKLETFHDHITVADLVFPEGITVLTTEDNIVASVSAPRTSSASEETTEEEGEEKTEGEEKS